MSFIIEILPVMSNEGAFAYVVRAQNGFPLGVFNSLRPASYLTSQFNAKA